MRRRFPNLRPLTVRPHEGPRGKLRVVLSYPPDPDRRTTMAAAVIDGSVN